MTQSRREIPPGTLDMLILRTLSRTEPLHGFEIAESIGLTSREVFQVEEGSLYPALQRMLLKGFLQAEWGRTTENRRARYYQLTVAGRKRLERELAEYAVTTTAIARILSPA